MDSPNERPERQPCNKRSNKPMMERKRRERINKSLDELKELILKAENKDISKYSKLEKADILEMSVKHVTALHQNSLGTSDGLTKYRSGFSHCTSAVEAYLTAIKDFPPTILRGMMAHLHKVLISVAKENIPQSNHKVKATTDKSILGCRSIRPKRSHPLEPITTYSQFSNGSSETQSRVQATTVDVPRLSSPSDFSTTQSLPFRLSPTIKCEMESPPDLTEYPPMGIIYNDNRPIGYSHNFIPHEAIPLNLTLHEQLARASQSSPSPPYSSKTNSPLSDTGHSHPMIAMPHSFVIQESSLTPNLPPSPPSERFSPISQSPERDNALLSTSAPSSRCLKDRQRPTPYPKKDAVKRYHSQILKRDNEDSHSGGGDRRDGGNSSNTHWRPW